MSDVEVGIEDEFEDSFEQPTELEVRAARFVGRARSLAGKTLKFCRYLDNNIVLRRSTSRELHALMRQCEELLKDPWPNPEKDWDELIAEKDSDARGTDG